MEQRTIYTVDKYKLRLFTVLAIVAMAFGFYFCWEVLYQERVLVNLLTFTEMERSREAAQGKHYLHDWIPGHYGSDGHHEEPGLRSVEVPSEQQRALLNHVPKTSADFAHQEAALAQAVDQRRRAGEKSDPRARLTYTETDNSYVEPTDAGNAETGRPITGVPLLKNLAENKEGGIPHHFRKNLDARLKAARQRRNKTWSLVFYWICIHRAAINGQ